MIDSTIEERLQHGGTYAVTIWRIVDGEEQMPGIDYDAYSQIRTAGGRLLATCAMTIDADLRAVRFSLSPAQVRTLPVGRHRQNVLYVLPDGTRDASPPWFVRVDPITTEGPDDV